MPLSLAQTQAVSALARHLYDYLPGSSRWRGTYTFAHAAREAGVESYWTPGSKLPALTGLLEATLDHRSGAFCPLVEIIVREGIKYRTKMGQPMTREDLADLNNLVRGVGYRIPSLWDPTLAASLPERPRAEVVAREPSPDSGRADRELTEKRNGALADLLARFMDLHGWADRQAAGRALETVLRDLFTEFALRPRGSFVVPGEQIDGSIVLDGDSYLVEAKWEAQPIGLAHLLVFREKVTGKSAFTRGIFVSINGYERGALTGITSGKQPNFLMIDGAHLFTVLRGDRDLVEMLRVLLRELADTGRPYVPLSELAPAD
ncbi:MAG: hypothetical protein ABSB34_12440 [Candidatus Limnocylindrales bacterium]